MKTKQEKKEYMLVWRAKNKERLASYKKSYNRENFVYNKVSMKKYKDSIKGRFSKLNTNARARGFMVGINLEEFTKIIGSPCYLCGDKGIMGVDRYDNSLGYLLENCRPCCRRCNVMKNDMSIDDFYRHVHKITQQFLNDK